MSSSSSSNQLPATPPTIVPAATTPHGHHKRNVSSSSATSVQDATLALSPPTPSPSPSPPPSKFLSIATAWSRVRTGADGRSLHAADFVAALRANTLVVDALGGAFNLINLDIAKNTRAITSAAAKHTATTLADIMDAERHPRAQGSDALLWMKRMLSFTDVMMSAFVSAPDSAPGTATRRVPLPQAVERAYRATLHDAHPMVVRMVAGGVKVVVPTREVFCERLGAKEEEVVEGVREFLVALKPKLAVLVEEFNGRGYERVAKCRVMPVPLPEVA